MTEPKESQIAEEHRRILVNEYCRNDDWRRNATTEEFAEWVVEVVFGDEFKKHIKQIGFAHMHSYKTEVVEWLKKPHKE